MGLTPIEKFLLLMLAAAFLTSHRRCYRCLLARSLPKNFSDTKSSEIRSLEGKRLRVCDDGVRVCVCVCMYGRTGGLCAILCVRMGKRPEETVGRLHYNNSSSLFHNFSISFALESFWANIFVWSMHYGKRSLSHQKEKYS